MKQYLTLDQQFSRLSETMLSFDKKNILSFLFEYASNIVQIEKVDMENPENKGFLEHIMDDKMSEIVEKCLFVSSHSDNPQNYTYILPLKGRNFDEKIGKYFANPLNRYKYEEFRDIKNKVSI